MEVEQENNNEPNYFMEVLNLEEQIVDLKKVFGKRALKEEYQKVYNDPNRQVGDIIRGKLKEPEVQTKVDISF